MRTIKKNERGFALVAALSIMSLLIMLALALLSLSTITRRSNSHAYHLEVARANALLALSQAVSDLQYHLGPDQRICADAAILEPSLKIADYINNRNWLGVWNTTVKINEKNWPVIGKKPDKGDLSHISPYPYKGIYSDLRHTEPTLTKNAWKTAMRRRWLVSGGDFFQPNELSKLRKNEEKILLVGKGTLGANLSATTATANAKLLYEKQKVEVPLIQIKNAANQITGRYAYWISNNNTRANIIQNPKIIKTTIQDEIALTPNPAAVQSINGSSPFLTFFNTNKENFAKILTNSTLALSQNTDKKDWQEHYFDFTTASYGMHINVQKGGFKKDLTPLLFGDPSKKTLALEQPKDSENNHLTNQANFPFSSDYPIIPGERHGTLGASYAALRHWGLKKYTLGLASGSIETDTGTIANAIQRRNDATWARGTSDGYGYSMEKWAKNAPKVLPIMTEANWHIGFSSSGKLGNNANLRFHIMPRVVLWNPYNVELKMPKLAVLLPNYFKLYRNNGTDANGNFRLKLYVEDEHAQELIAAHQATYPNINSWQKVKEGGNQFNIQTGNYYFVHINARVFKSQGNQSWAPTKKYIGFELEQTTLNPGEALVFSPNVDDAPGTTHQQLSETAISANRLSPRYQMGEDSFFLEPSYPGTEISLGTTSNKIPKTYRKTFINNLDFTRVFRYRMQSPIHVNPHAVLKLIPKNAGNVSTDTIISSSDYPTLQLINCGQGGTGDGRFEMNNIFADSRLSIFIENSEEDPETVDYPRRFQSGVKLLWLDETAYEDNDQESYRFHPFEGIKSGSIAMQLPPIAHGSVRPAVTTRAPHHFTTMNYYMYSAGNWIASYAFPSPDEDGEKPLFLNGRYSKNPLGSSTQQHSNATNVILFELPHPEFGTLSLASLRHAHISPFSWHPSYIIGNSLADLSAPADHSAHPFLQTPYNESAFRENTVHNSFDYYLGGVAICSEKEKNNPKKRYWNNWGKSTSIQWGSSTGAAINYYSITNNETLLNIGKEKKTSTINGVTIDSEDEILGYDISYEVNQNLFDDYFFSGMPLEKTEQKSFDWKIGEPLYNGNLSFNKNTDLSEEGKKKIEQQLNQTEQAEAIKKQTTSAALAYGFWNNAYLLKLNNQFNINSTSIKAWTAQLSALRDQQRETLSGQIIQANQQHLITRVRTPFNLNNSEGTQSTDLNGAKSNAYKGARLLTDAEIRLLAENIVLEVKKRGPFLSLADFVNRRLSDAGTITTTPIPHSPHLRLFAGNDDPTSRMGALEAAIKNSNLNESLKTNPLLTTTAYTSKGKQSYKNASLGFNPLNAYGIIANHRGYGTHTAWQPDYDNRQAKSKNWGIPSFITQGDLLTPLMPNLSARGEQFTLRVAGQSVKNDKIMATAYLEAGLIRQAEYIDSTPINTPINKEKNCANRANTPALKINQLTGEIQFNELKNLNKQLGRRFKFISIKWLNSNEI